MRKIMQIETKKHLLSVMIVLCLTCIFLGFISLFGIKTVDATFDTDVTVSGANAGEWEKIVDGERLKLTETTSIAALKDGAYVIPYWNFTFGDVDRAEFSIDIFSTAQFRFFIAKTGHYLDYALPSYTGYYSDGTVTFTRYAESQVYYAANSVLTDHTLALPGASGINALSVSATYGFNMKVTYLGPSYSAINKSDSTAITDAGTLLRYDITPYDADGNVVNANAKSFYYYTAFNRGVYDTTSNYHVGLVSLGASGVTVVDNVRLVTYATVSDTTGTVKCSNECNSADFSTIENVPYGNKLNASIRTVANGTRGYVKDERIVKKTAISSTEVSLAENTSGNGYIIPLKQINISQKLELSFDIKSFSRFIAYLAPTDNYFTGNASYYDAGIFGYNDGKLTYKRSNSGWLYKDANVTLDGNSFTFGSSTYPGGDNRAILNNVSNGLNVKVIFYSNDYLTPTNNYSVIEYTFTPYDANGNLDNANALHAYTFGGGKTVNSSKNFHVGLQVSGIDEDNPVVLDNVVIENFTAGGNDRLLNKTWENMTSDRNDDENKVFVGFRTGGGTVNVSSVNIMRGSCDFSELSVGKKYGLLIGMDDKTQKVGDSGTSFIYFTNKQVEETTITYLGYADNGAVATEVSLGSNFVGSAFGFAFQINPNGRIVVKVGSVTKVIYVASANLTGYTEFVSYGSGTASATLSDLSVDKYFVNGEMLFGAYLRLTEIEYSGIRFETHFNADTVENLQDMLDAEQIQSVSYGTLISRKDLLGETELTIETLVAAGIWHKDIVSTTGFIDSISSSTSKGYWGSIVGIQEANYEREFVGRGYVKITYADNSEFYFYADYNNGNINNNSRSVYSVAKAYYLSDDYKDYADNDVAESYIDGTVNLTVAGGNITYNGEFEGYIKPYIAEIDGDVLTITSTARICSVVINGIHINADFDESHYIATCSVSDFEE